LANTRRRSTVENKRAGNGVRLMDRLRTAIRIRRYSPNTEKAYCRWVRRFIFFHGKRHPSEMGPVEVAGFLNHLVVKENVSASTQNQALCALVFLYRRVLGTDLGELPERYRATRPKNLPVFLTEAEVARFLDHLDGDIQIIGELLYGAGLRIGECLKLRVLDLDFAHREVRIFCGKGRKSRKSVIPDRVIEPLRGHLAKVCELHDEDRNAGWGRVTLPNKLGTKYRNAAAEWRWQFVFPQRRRWRNEDGVEGRHHLDPSIVLKAFKASADRLGFTKRVTCHTLRHSFATHLLAAGTDIRTVQTLLGHASVKTTMIYTHILNQNRHGIVSPMDRLPPRNSTGA